jgi:hypothetical protein
MLPEDGLFLGSGEGAKALGKAPEGNLSALLAKLCKNQRAKAGDRRG